MRNWLLQIPVGFADPWTLLGRGVEGTKVVPRRGTRKAVRAAGHGGRCDQLGRDATTKRFSAEEAREARLDLSLRRKSQRECSVAVVTASADDCYGENKPRGKRRA